MLLSTSKQNDDKRITKYCARHSRIIEEFTNSC